MSKNFFQNKTQDVIQKSFLSAVKVIRATLFLVLVVVVSSDFASEKSIQVKKTIAYNLIFCNVLQWILQGDILECVLQSSI